MTDLHLLIRDARPDELDSVSLLLKEAYLQYSKNLPEDAWNYYLQDVMDVRSRFNESKLIVAEDDNKLAGAVTLYLDPRDSEDDGWPGGWAGIRLLGVHPSYRNHGIGRALMEECINRCRAKGIMTIGLHTTVAMEVARRMYEKMGFVRVPEFDFHPRPGVVVMAYRLDINNRGLSKNTMNH